MTSNLTTKTIRATAASVAGARRMGIATAASEAAPALLERAEAVLAPMLAHAAGMEPSAPDETEELRYYAAAGQVVAYMAAIDELRAALGLETYAAIQARDKEALAESSRSAREQREAEEAAQEADQAAKKAAADQASRSSECAATAAAHGGAIVDGRGVRVALMQRSSHAETRMSSLGWDDGGDLIENEARLIAEDGRDVTNEAVAIIGHDGEFCLQQVYRRTYPNGGEGWYGGNLVACDPTATSEWLPNGVTMPEQRSEWSVAVAWVAADQHAADQALMARLSAMPEAWLAKRAMLVKSFIANPNATHGGWNGGDHSVRADLLAEVDEVDAAEKAEKAEKAARQAASPFAALAALKL